MNSRSPFLACCLLGASLSAGCSPLGVLNALSSSGHYASETGVAYGSERRQQLDVYRPLATAPEAPVVVFFYGAAAVAWVGRNIEGLGGGGRPLFLAGHSAGAHIAALLAYDRRYLDEFADPPAISGFIGLSGPYDFLPLEEGYLQEVFPQALRERSQPIHFVSAKAPPTLLIHGADDTRVLPGNSVHLLQALRSHDVPATLEIYPDTGHARVVAALAPPLAFLGDTLGDVIEFIEATRQ